MGNSEKDTLIQAEQEKRVNMSSNIMDVSGLWEFSVESDIKTASKAGPEVAYASGRPRACVYQGREKFKDCLRPHYPFLSEPFA